MSFLLQPNSLKKDICAWSWSKYWHLGSNTGGTSDAPNRSDPLDHGPFVRWSFAWCWQCWLQGLGLPIPNIQMEVGTPSKSNLQTDFWRYFIVTCVSAAGILVKSPCSKPPEPWHFSKVWLQKIGKNDSNTKGKQTHRGRVWRLVEPKSHVALVLHFQSQHHDTHQDEDSHAKLLRNKKNSAI